MTVEEKNTGTGKREIAVRWCERNEDGGELERDRKKKRGERESEKKEGEREREVVRRGE